MKSKPIVAVAALMCAVAVGCDSTGTTAGTTTGGPPVATNSFAPTSPTTTTTAQEAPDYARLLLQPADISDDEDTFTTQSSKPTGPDGLPGASAFFVNQDDTRAIADTVVIYPDAQTAAATLQSALPTIDKTVTGATPRPAPGGTHGTMAVGMSPDGSKAVTLLLFTEGPALVRLEFQSAPGDVTTDRYVTDTGKKQQIALRTGLPKN